MEGESVNSNVAVEPGSRIRPMSNLTYRAMEWILYVWDIFLRHPKADLKKVPLKRGMTVVDYGCGPGHYTIPVAQTVGPGGRVYAVDVQPLAIQRIAGEATRRSLHNITTIIVDSYDTGIPSSSVDVALLIDVFHYITDRQALFSEICRFLKPDGLLYMDAGHMKATEVKRIVESLGFFNVVGFDGKNMSLKKTDATNKWKAMAP